MFFFNITYQDQGSSKGKGGGSSGSRPQQGSQRPPSPERGPRRRPQRPHSPEHGPKLPTQPGKGRSYQPRQWVEAGQEKQRPSRAIKPKESGKGTKGGLGGWALKAAEDPDWWQSLSVAMQANLQHLGRLESKFEIRMRVPWPDVYWKTFPKQDEPFALWDAKRRAEEEAMELIVKERRNKKVTLTLLGNSRHEMGLFLEQILTHCETATGAEAFQAVRVYLSSHPEMFSTDAASQVNLEADADENAPDPEMPTDAQSEPDWDRDSPTGDADEAEEASPDDTVGSATVVSTADAATCPEHEQQPEEADAEVAADLSSAAATATQTPVPEDTPLEAAFMINAGSKSLAKPKPAMLKRQTQPGVTEVPPRPRLPAQSQRSSSERRLREQRARGEVWEPQPPLSPPPPPPQQPLPPEQLPEVQQRGEQNEPAPQLQTQPERTSQPPQPTQEQSAAQNPKIVLKPKRSIPLSFYKELKNSCAAAASLDAQGQSIGAIIKAAADTWMQTGRVNAVHEGRWDGFFVCLCTTMFKREASWKNAFPLQLAVALMFAPRVKIFLVTFADDTSAWDYCIKHAQWALDLGILYVASSGDKAGEVVPPSARQRYWHASQCKNAAHVFAAQEVKKQGIAPESVLLVNVDADNIMPPAYLEHLLSGFQAETQRATMAGLSPQLAPLRAIVARSATGGLTGRIAMSLPDFARLGGYDEEPGTYGTGYQDIDLLVRAKAVVTQFTNETQNLLLRKDSPAYTLPCDAGAAFLNEPNIAAKEDRGWAKIKNLDPEVIKVFKTWGRINQANVNRLCAKTNQGLIGRNGVGRNPRLDQTAAWHLDNLLSLRLGSKFHRHPSPEVPWDGARLRVHLLQQLQPTTEPASSSVGSATEPLSSSVGSATEPLGSSSSSTTTSKARPAQPINISQPEQSAGDPPRAKARPLQKQTTFDVASRLLFSNIKCVRCKYFTHTFRL